ncbi:hypothetical protein CEP52_003466 [Fusarium oligoseptatum]|uniref:Dynein light chain n=1 Tax=Fusarium oligoseptatum TaxID=2604345 RepID=A0A428U8N2_9HYPO|nr:hypothetical protein CEP52_003466 [Fusarium oligoseptatum]
MSDIKATETPAPREKLEAQIKSADMTEDMQQESIEVAQEAMAKFTIEKDIAQHIKRTFDERKGPTWHCIVGRNFGSFVTHETKHFIYFYLGHCAILLFKNAIGMGEMAHRWGPLEELVVSERDGVVGQGEERQKRHASHRIASRLAIPCHAVHPTLFAYVRDGRPWRLACLRLY